jgi:hypothetical protein
MQVIPIVPSKTLAERVGNRFRGPASPQFAEKLDLGQSVAAVWPEPRPDGDLHVIVTGPGGVGNARGEPTSNTCPPLWSMN